MSFNTLFGQKISYELGSVSASLRNLKNDEVGVWLEVVVKGSPLVGKTYISKQKTGEAKEEKINFLMSTCLFIQQWLILNRAADTSGFDEFVRKIGAYGVGDIYETPAQYAASVLQ